MGLHEQRAIMLRGDPGLWGALKGAVKGFVTGGPLGAIRGGVSGLLDRQAAGPSPQIPPPGMSGVPVPGTGGFYPLTRMPGVLPALQAALPFGQTGMGVQIPGVAADGRPAGYHINKSGYWTKAGYVPPRSRWVRNRTRNVSNGRANTRALSRIVAWDKIDRKRRTALKRIAR